MGFYPTAKFNPTFHQAIRALKFPGTNNTTCEHDISGETQGSLNLAVLMAEKFPRSSEATEVAGSVE